MTAIIELNAGGKILATTTATLQKVSGSYLDRLTRDASALRDAQGRLFVDCDGKRFGMVLDHLRGQSLPILKPEKTTQLQEDAVRFELPSLTRALCAELTLAQHSFAEDTFYGQYLRAGALLRQGDEEGAYDVLWRGIFAEADDSDKERRELAAFWEAHQKDWAVTFIHGFRSVHSGKRRAVALLRSAATLNPDAACIPIALTKALMMQRRYRAAASVARTALIRHPNRWELHMRLGIALGMNGRKNKDFEPAAEAIQKAADLADGKLEQPMLQMLLAEILGATHNSAARRRALESFMTSVERWDPRPNPAKYQQMRAEMLASGSDGSSGREWQAAASESDDLVWRLARHRVRPLVEDSSTESKGTDSERSARSGVLSPVAVASEESSADSESEG